MKKPIIIAECCQNHNGDINILEKMVYEAANNGADYVKIQAIRSSELTYRAKFDTGIDEKTGQKCIVRTFKSEKDRLSKLDLNLDEEKYFVDLCKKVGIKSMVTLFTWSGLYESINLGYDAIKVASYDCASFRFIKEIKKYWDKIFVSTGATYEHEIEKTVNILEGSDYHLLHCVTIYPTKLNQLHLSRMEQLRKYNENIGFSDHTKPYETGLIASKLAIWLGASCIERHFTILDENLTKDGPVSINPHQLNELSEFGGYDKLKQKEIIEDEFPSWQASLGNPDRKLSTEELMNRDYYRGRFASSLENKVVNNWENFAKP